MEDKAVPVPMLSAEVQKRIGDLWALKDTTFHLIKHSENHTYLIKEGESENAKRHILRLTPHDHRSQAAVEAELEFTLLVDAAIQPKTHSTVRICRPIPLVAPSSNRYLAITKAYADKGDERDWYTVLFEHAEGRGCVDKWLGLHNEGIVEAWGRSLGQMHQAIAIKGGDAGRWDAMSKQLPTWDETHLGAATIEKIRTRAKEGVDTAQMLEKAWEEKLNPFLTSLGEQKPTLYGVVHGDLNVSNFWAETLNEGDHQERIWVFDFDQTQRNWFGFELGLVLNMVAFFNDIKWGDGFDGEKFKEVFLKAYAQSYPPMVEAGHLEPHMLKGWELQREFFEAAVASDVLYQVEKDGRHYEDSITSFCRIIVERFRKKAGGQA